MGSHKVIGYVSIGNDKSEMLCDEVACVIAGNNEFMRDYIRHEVIDSLDEHIIKKTRYGEIERGIELGAEYLFDEVSFKRFKEVLERRPIFSKLKIIEKEKEWASNKFYNVKLG